MTRIKRLEKRITELEKRIQELEGGKTTLSKAMQDEAFNEWASQCYGSDYSEIMSGEETKAPKRLEVAS